VLQVVQASHAERAPTLAEVVGLMDPHRLAGSLRSLPRPLAERVQDYLAGLTPDQLSAIRGLQTRLAIVTESHTGALLEPGAGAQLDVRAALDGDEVVLFSLNSSTYGKLAAQLGTLAVQDLVCAAGHRLSRDGPRQSGLATVAIDESSVLGENLISLFARSREAGIGVLAATQEMADFDRVAHGLRDQVLGNTALKVAHRQDVPSSAQTVAQMAGTEKTWEYTERVGGGLLGAYGSGGGTRRLGEQFVIHPNHVKTLRTGEAVLISKLRGGRASTVRVSPPKRDGPEIG
jgi:conjugal transfer pilus assembly protein TraD